jgi:hypothetical protein
MRENTEVLLAEQARCSIEIIVIHQIPPVM